MQFVIEVPEPVGFYRSDCCTGGVVPMGKYNMCTYCGSPCTPVEKQ